MNYFINCLADKKTHFSVEMIYSDNLDKWLAKQFLENPSVVISIDSYSYQSFRRNNCFKVDFRVSYVHEEEKAYVFAARDTFEITTAISIILRLHMDIAYVVVDNENGFIDSREYFSLINSCKEYVGEDFQQSQERRHKSNVSTFCNGKVIVYKIETEYFNKAEEVNLLSCFLANQAKNILKGARNQLEVVNRVMLWFRNNVRYLDTDRPEDHSAVGLLTKGTAVCQGIASYAYMLLYYCDVEARYVSGVGNGSGGWGPHAWNMVKIDDQWNHVDYTFALNSLGDSILQTEEDFRKDHKWDELKYSNIISDTEKKYRKLLRHSILTLLPEEDCFAINGCIVDTSKKNRICIVNDGNVYVSVFQIVSIFGGCYSFSIGSLRVYFVKKEYRIMARDMFENDGEWYMKAVELRKIGLHVGLQGKMVIVENNN